MTRSFTVVVGTDQKGRVLVPVPFDPDQAWGEKLHHHVAGTVNGMGVRGVLEPFGNSKGLLLGLAWRRGCGIQPGDQVSVMLTPEGPQRDQLPVDIAAALDAEPEAGEFFDSIAQFYRKAYLTWIGATKRRPEVRAERISQMIELLKAKQKQRP